MLYSDGHSWFETASSWHHRHIQEHYDNSIYDVMRNFDHSGNGHVSRQEFVDGLRDMGYPGPDVVRPMGQAHFGERVCRCPTALVSVEMCTRNVRL